VALTSLEIILWEAKRHQEAVLGKKRNIGAPTGAATVKKEKDKNTFFVRKQGARKGFDGTLKEKDVRKKFLQVTLIY